MKIKRTVKEGYAEAGKTETIGEERMRNIIMQCYSLGALNVPASEEKEYGSDEAIRRLRENGNIESFYAKYELISI